MHLLSCGMFLLADIHISIQQSRPSLSAVQEGSRRAANNRMFSTMLTSEVFIEAMFVPLQILPRHSPVYRTLSFVSYPTQLHVT